jgi:hypothetical protein
MFEEEEIRSKKFTEEYKKKLSEEIKQFKPENIKNTETVERKYNIWERLLKTLGMS